MWTWILTASVIVSMAAAALELFRETEDPGSSTPSRDWERMTNAELDALVEEFSGAESENPEPMRSLAA